MGVEVGAWVVPPVVVLVVVPHRQDLARRRHLQGARMLDPTRLLQLLREHTLLPPSGRLVPVRLDIATGPA